MAIVISTNMILGELPLEIPLTHPRFFYQSFFRTGTVTPSGDGGSPEAFAESDEFAVENCTLDPATWNFWRPAAMPASLTVELDEAAPADYCLIPAHTLGSDAVQVTVEYLDEDLDSWVTLAEVMAGSDRVLVILFEETTARQFRVTFTGSQVPSIGVVMLGKALVMPRGVTLDHGPITLSRQTPIEPNVSVSGQYLGRSIRREGVGTEIRFGSLRASFIRGDFAPFMDHARAMPFGWAWAPEEYPAEVAYCWTNDDIRPVHAGQQAYLDVSFHVDGMLD